MSPHPHLYTTNRPWLHCVNSDHNQLADYLLSAQLQAPRSSSGECIVRLLRGTKMHSYEGLYNEFAAALQFPYYFGENQAAFDECLSDLEWLSGACFILAISDADQLLDQEDGEALADLLVLLEDIAREWNTPTGDVDFRQPTPFHVLFHFTPARESAFWERASPSGLMISELKIR